MAGQFTSPKLIHQRETKPQNPERTKEKNFNRELESSRYIEDSLSSNVTKARASFSHNEELKRRDRRHPLTINSDRKHKQNECTLKDIIKHQLRFVGDNCNIVKPVPKHLSNSEVKGKGDVCSTFSVKKKQGRSIVKVNTVSKHTISYMDSWQTNTDNISRLLDEMDLDEPSSKTLSRKGENNETNKNSNRARSVNTRIRSEKCSCLQTHLCLVSVDSEDFIGDLVHDDDDDYAFHSEILTPQELSLVETGSDEDWLYKPTKKLII